MGLSKFIYRLHTRRFIVNCAARSVGPRRV